MNREHLRDLAPGTRLRDLNGYTFTLVQYFSITDQYQIEYDRWPGVVSYTSGGSLTSFMVFPD